MMKKNLLVIPFTALSLVIASSVFAVTTPAAKTPEKTAQHAQPAAAKKAAEAQVDLYESPNTTSKIIKTLSPNADLIAIFHQGDWVKVGDRTDGSTGWVHLPQYHQAKNDYYRDHFHTYVNSVYMSTHTDKNGKTVVEAYRNGKKLSDLEAQKLFNQMRVQEQNQWIAMQQDYLNAQHALDAAFHAPMFMMPGIIVVQSPPEQDTKPAVATQKTLSQSQNTK